MRVLVCGVGNPVGRRLVDHALADDHAVRVLGRSLDGLDPHENLDPVRGSVCDERRVAGAVRGCDAVLSAVGAGAPAGGRADRVAAGTRNLVDAMRAAGVRRIVAVGSAAVLPGANGGPRLSEPGFPPHRRAAAERHRQAYDALRTSGLRWTLVCPPDAPTGPRTDRYRTAVDRLPPGGRWVTTGDVAAFAYRALVDGDHVEERVGIAY